MLVNVSFNEEAWFGWADGLACIHHTLTTVPCHYESTSNHGKKLICYTQLSFPSLENPIKGNLGNVHSAQEKPITAKTWFFMFIWKSNWSNILSKNLQERLVSGKGPLNTNRSSCYFGTKRSWSWIISVFKEMLPSVFKLQAYVTIMC